MDNVRISKIALGGGCHWCTEAVFQNLKGVLSVKQGYIASVEKNSSFSEGIIIEYEEKEIPLKVIIEIHLLTHKSTTNHSRRHTYRSAIYTYSSDQESQVKQILKILQYNFEKIIITQVLPYQKFKPSRPAIQNYYQKNPEKPFCKRYIHPKLSLLQTQFANFVKT